MKKHIKSLFLIGIVLCINCDIATARSHESYPTFGSVGQSIAGLAGSIIPQALLSLAIHYAGNNIHSIIENLKGYTFQSSNEPIPHQTHSELSPLAKESSVHSEIKEILDPIKDTRQACPLLMLTGPTGTGKSVEAEIIAAYMDSPAFYNIPADLLQRYNDEKKINILHNIAGHLSNITPADKKSVIHLEEFGNEFIKATKPDAEKGWKRFTEEILGERNKDPLYPNIIFVVSSNATEVGPIDPAIAGRIKLVNMLDPNDKERIEFFRKCHLNIAENAQKYSRQEIDHMPIACPTFIEAIKSLFWKRSNNELQQEKNDYLKRKFLVTDNMIEAAQAEHIDKIATLQQEAHDSKVSWNFANIVFPQWRQHRQERNIEAQDIQKKIKEYENKGYATPVVTQKLDNITQKNLKYLALKTKTKKVIEKNADGIESKVEKPTNRRDINENYLKKAEGYEIAFIKNIKKHLDENHIDEVTEESNPALFTMMKIHKKYCSPILSDNNKAAAKNVIPAKFTINPDDRTYTYTPVNTDQESEPVTFGAITKVHLGVAACKGNISQFDKEKFDPKNINKKIELKKDPTQKPKLSSTDNKAPRQRVVAPTVAKIRASKAKTLESLGKK
ncbi:MAG: ATP-binding protein [Candidatus Dependentiae bacterium]|nr:ATP-binding protein [Candidatus Dependentiae bacterium]